MVVNLRSSFQTLEIKEQFLDEKKQQTAKKVQYVSEYITQWAHISTARKEVTHITLEALCSITPYSWKKPQRIILVPYVTGVL